MYVYDWWDILCNVTIHEPPHILITTSTNIAPPPPHTSPSHPHPKMMHIYHNIKQRETCFLWRRQKGRGVSRRIPIAATNSLQPHQRAQIVHSGSLPVVTNKAAVCIWWHQALTNNDRCLYSCIRSSIDRPPLVLWLLSGDSDQLMIGVCSPPDPACLAGDTLTTATHNNTF